MTPTAQRKGFAAFADFQTQMNMPMVNGSHPVTIRFTIFVW